MKKVYFSVLLVLGMGMTATKALAQEYTSARGESIDYNPHKYQFVGVQGGVTHSFNNYFDVKREIGDAWAPTMSISYGGFWSRILGARLHVNGLWNKTGIACAGDHSAVFHNYNYITPNADLLINLCNANNGRDVYPLNVLLVAGLGSQLAWEKDGRAEAAAAKPHAQFTCPDNDFRAALNTRLGLIFDVPIRKHWSVNLEADLNYVETFTDNVFNSDNLQFVAQLGVNYKFGYNRRHKVRAEVGDYTEQSDLPLSTDATAATATTQVKRDSIPYDEINYRTVTQNRSGQWEVYYPIRETAFDDSDAKLAKIGAFLQKYRNCKVSIKSYSDVETGNPTLNMEYSKQRAEKALKALVEAGVNKEQITVEYFGDTVQPFATNEHNRCTIISATGLEDVQQQYTVRKFKPAE